MRSTTNNRIRGALARRGPAARALVAVALACIMTTACDVHGVSDPGTLASITVTPNATMAAVSTQQMIAVGHDADGRVITISPTWSVAASGGGTISSTGMFSAGAVTGVFTNNVVATVGLVSGHASITVTPGALASITVLPSPVTLAVAARQQFVAVAHDVSGNFVQVLPTWSVVSGGGSIDSTGLFTAGGAAGTYTNTVQASNNGIKAFATVTVTVGPLASISVTPSSDTLVAGAKQQFVATGKDAGGNTVAVAAAWSVTAGGGSTDQAGLFTAGAVPGTFTNTIKATSGTLSGTATVVVTAGPLAAITVTPNPATMTLSGGQQFVAVGTDVAGNAVAIAPTWAVVANGGTIIGSGLFTAGTVSGTFTNTIRASVGGLSGFATVIVTSGPLASITVTPNPVSMPTNSTQQFVAVGKDASGNVFVMSPIWAVINGGGVINSAGMFTAGGAPGPFSNTVQATSGAISGTASVTVTPSAPPPPLVALGAATSDGILAATTVTCTTTGTINADVSISPGSALVGFGPCVITGVQHLADGVALQAQIDMQTAYTTLAGLPCAPANFIVADLGGTTRTAGVWCTASGIGVTGTLTLDGGGNPNATFVFQAGSSLVTAGSVVLINGAQAKNVYWVLGSSATLGTASAWQGNILAHVSISLNTTATLFGRALAHTGAVTLTTGNTITLP